LGLSDGRPRRDVGRISPRGAAFIPVQVVATKLDREATSDVPWLEISAGKLLCRVPVHVDESTLRRLVRVLREETSRC
jgi:hypothetical protein